eukprot:3969384-Pleurochrysis_carterae.AAC.1
MRCASPPTAAPRCASPQAASLCASPLLRRVPSLAQFGQRALSLATGHAARYLTVARRLLFCCPSPPAAQLCTSPPASPRAVTRRLRRALSVAEAPCAAVLHRLRRALHLTACAVRYPFTARHFTPSFTTCLEPSFAISVVRCPLPAPCAILPPST